MEQTLYCPFQLEPSWKAVLEDELQKPYIQQLASFLVSEKTNKFDVYPPEDLIFNAFKTTPFKQVKVLVIGQDPYHGPLQAHGLSFSVPKGVRAPPSLQNIFKELQEDLGLPIPSHGCLLPWAEQGVMLLNATLTVRRGEPLSHHNKGWEEFTDAVVAALAERKEPIIFVLWGKSAKDKLQRLNLSRHCVLQAAHPSPLSAHNGFFGCHHFSKINQQLSQWGKKEIDWRLN